MRKGFGYAFANNSNKKNIKYLTSFVNNDIIKDHLKNECYFVWINISSFEILKYFFQIYEVEIPILNEYSRDCLSFNKNYKIIEFLVENKKIMVDINYLFSTCRNNKSFEIIKYFLEEYEKSNNLIGNETNIFLILCLNQNIEIIKNFYQNYNINININQLDVNGQNAFELAIQNHNIQILQYLVEELNFNYIQFQNKSFYYFCQASLYGKNNQNKSFDYFCQASLYENFEIVKYLVNLKFDVYSVNEKGMNILEIFEKEFIIAEYNY